MKRPVIWIVMLAVPLTVGAAAWAAGDKAGDTAAAPKPEARQDAVQACTNMMQGQGATEEGQRAMREFMQSDRAPQAMANMMAMAGRMGNGDVMLGMTRMMEMMGGQGGMMGGDGMKQPGPRK